MTSVTTTTTTSRRSTRGDSPNPIWVTDTATPERPGAKIVEPAESAGPAECDRPTTAPLSQEDLALVAALRQGDERAFTNLVARYQAKLLRMAKGFVRSEAIAEEVVQETWLGVVEGIHRFEGRSSLKTWICRILANKAITRGRQESTRLRYGSQGMGASLPEEVDGRPLEASLGGYHLGPGHSRRVPRAAWNADTPEQELLAKEWEAHLLEAIHSLPPIQQRVIRMHGLLGIDSVDICRILGISESNKHVLLHRARAKVWQKFQDYLGETPGSVRSAGSTAGLGRMPKEAA